MTLQGSRASIVIQSTLRRSCATIRAVLLAGPSAMGKSTLAYLPMPRVFALGDDRVCADGAEPPHLGSRERRDSRPRRSHCSRELGTAGVSLTPASGGKSSSPTLPSDWSRSAASRVVVCASSNAVEAALDRISAAERVKELLSQLSPGSTGSHRMERVVEMLTAGGGWRLTLTEDAWEAAVSSTHARRNRLRWATRRRYTAVSRSGRPAGP